MELAPKTASSIALAILCISIGLGMTGIYKANTKQSLMDATAFYDDGVQDINSAIRGKEYPVITAENQRIELHEAFDPKTWVNAQDIQDGDITSHVDWYGVIDNTVKGDYEIRYSVRNSFGMRTEKKIRVIVD